jgi:hypothetical protein
VSGWGAVVSTDEENINDCFNYVPLGTKDKEEVPLNCSEEVMRRRALQKKTAKVAPMQKAPPPVAKRAGKKTVAPPPLAKRAGRRTTSPRGFEIVKVMAKQIASSPTRTAAWAKGIKAAKKEQLAISKMLDRRAKLRAERGIKDAGPKKKLSLAKKRPYKEVTKEEKKRSDDSDTDDYHAPSPVFVVPSTPKMEKVEVKQEVRIKQEGETRPHQRQQILEQRLDAIHDEHMASITISDDSDDGDDGDDEEKKVRSVEFVDLCGGDDNVQDEEEEEEEASPTPRSRAVFTVESLVFRS